MSPLRQCFAFMKRHDRSFLISSFLVFFITFVVRDILMDRVRMMADKLSAAETAFLLENSTAQLDHEIDVVDGHVMSGNSDILANFPSHHNRLHLSPDPESILDRNSVQDLRMVRETSTEFAILYRILDLLPLNNSNRADFSKLYARWDKDQVGSLKPIPLIGVKVDPVVAKTEAEKDRKRLQDMWSINGEIQMLGASSLDDAQRNIEEKEHETNVFAWCSYVLTFFSGVLALSCKFAGIETVTA